MALCYIQKAMKCDIRMVVYALHNLIQVFKALSNSDGEMETCKLLYQVNHIAQHQILYQCLKNLSVRYVYSCILLQLTKVTSLLLHEFRDKCDIMGYVTLSHFRSKEFQRLHLPCKPDIKMYTDIHSDVSWESSCTLKEQATFIKAS